MRTIGNLESQDTADRFRDYLYAQNIEAQTEAEDDGAYSVWVLDDDDLPRARQLLEQFRAVPDAIDFRAAAAEARQKRDAELRAEKKRRSTVADSARIGYERHFSGVPYVAYALMVISIAVVIYALDTRNMRIAGGTPGLDVLRASEHFYDWGSGDSMHIRTGELTPGFLPEVRSGQIWRLITPIFLHFHFLHILFNMWILKDLGAFIEGRFGSRYFLALALAFAVFSNFAQALWGNPLFGGMSGVNYGLLGFLWIRGRFDRHAGWELNKTTVQVMLIWYVLCFTGVFGHIANTAHTAGLIAGMAWGWFSSGRPTGR